VRDSTDSLTSYFNDNSKEIGASVVQVIKSNPIPAALIGLGVGWLLVENYMGSSRSHQPDNRYYNDQYGSQYGNQYSSQYGGEYGGEYGSQYSGAGSSGLSATREMTPSFVGQYQILSE
jgi:hypothetical protein